MGTRLTKKAKEAFENIKRIDEEGHEYWSSRDLSKVLEYSDYRYFEDVARRAYIACKNSGINPADHFVVNNEMVKIGSNAEREIVTVFMSRYACYLAMQNASSAKPIVAQAQTYFAIQTRRAELLLNKKNTLTEEEEKRLLLRNEMRKHNTQLAGAANNAGVKTPLDYAIFQNEGYKGLYGGLDRKDIHERKGLKNLRIFLTTWASRNWQQISFGPRHPKPAEAGTLKVIRKITDFRRHIQTAGILSADICPAEPSFQ